MILCPPNSQDVAMMMHFGFSHEDTLRSAQRKLIWDIIISISQRRLSHGLFQLFASLTHFLSEFFDEPPLAIDRQDKPRCDI